MESWQTRLARISLNLFPAYLGTGGRCIYLAADWRTARIQLPLNWRTRNYHGTIFGGSMVAAIDPIYFLLLGRLLGREYVVWDKSASIRYLKPGRETLYATFQVRDEDLSGIREGVAANGKTDWETVVELTTAAGEVAAVCTKVLNIRWAKRANERSAASVIAP